MLSGELEGQTFVLSCFWETSSQNDKKYKFAPPYGVLIRADVLSLFWKKSSHRC